MTDEPQHIGHEAVAERQRLLRGRSFKFALQEDGTFKLHHREVLPAPVVVPQPEPEPVKVPEAGEVMDDGTVYAGALPDGKQIFAAPQDAKDASGTTLALNFNKASEYAEKLNEEKYLGRTDWRVPSIEELHLLYVAREKGGLKNTFNEAGAGPAGWYRSSSPGPDASTAMVERFNDGYRFKAALFNENTVRFVCG